MLNRIDAKNFLDAVSIRRRGWGEIKQLESIFEEALIGQCMPAYSPKQMQVLLTTNNPRRYSSHLTYVAECDRKIVGYASIWNLTIQAIYVAPEYGRRGIGRKLLAAIENRARSRSSARLLVTASVNAEGFYRACGFRRLRQAITHYPQFQEIGIPVVEMEKIIGEN